MPTKNPLTSEKGIEQPKSLLKTINRSRNATSLTTAHNIPSIEPPGHISSELLRFSTKRPPSRYASQNGGFGAQALSMGKSPSSPEQYHSSPELHEKQLSPTNPASRYPVTSQIAIYTGKPGVYANIIILILRPSVWPDRTLQLPDEALLLGNRTSYVRDKLRSQ